MKLDAPDGGLFSGGYAVSYLALSSFCRLCEGGELLDRILAK